MADIFVSYASEDRPRVARLVAELEGQGWSVWWDRALVPGDNYERIIETVLDEARCVVVVWTEASVHSDWVHAEAGEGLQRDCLIPVALDAVRLPLAFRHRQAAMLTGWPRRRDAAELDRFLAGVRYCVERQAGTGPATAAPSAAMRRTRWRVWGIAAAGTAALAALAFLWLHPVPDAAAPTRADARKPTLVVMGSPAEAETLGPLLLDVGDRIDRYSAVHVVDDGESAGPVGGVGEDVSRSTGAQFRIDAALEGGRLTMTLDRLADGGTVWKGEYNLAEVSLAEVAALATERLAGALAPNEHADSTPVPAEAYRRYLTGRGLLSQGMTVTSADAAVDAFRNALEVLPRYPEAHAGLCRAYLARYQASHVTTDFDDAERHCFRALTMGAERGELYLALGNLYRIAGRFDESVDTLKKALKLDRYNSAALRGLADAYASQGLVDQAVQEYQAAIAVEPTLWQNYNGLGGLYFSVGQYHDAAKYFRESTNFVPENVTTLNNLGAAYYLSGDFDQAVQTWEHSVAVNPDVTTLSNLGTALFFLGEFERAREVYVTAAEKAPEDYRLWGNAGDASLFIDAESAQPYYTKAIDLAGRHLAVNPEDETVLSHLATYHAALGESDAARSCLERAEATGSKDVYLVYDRAVTEARLGDYEAARTRLNELVGLGYSPALLAADANFKTLGLTVNEEQTP